MSASLALAPLSFEPQALSKPWGGKDLLQAFGVAVTDDRTGEVWLLSDVDGRPSVVADGPLKGRTLRDLVASFPDEILGRARRGDERFPLLVKILEVDGRLSLQVHPDGAGARKNGDGPSGKFEAWSVLAAKPEARVSLGLARAASADEVRALVRSNGLEARLDTFTPSAGDAYVISPGTIHAASGGLLFLEVQETADVTYRLYDWGTKGFDGKPRELHVEKALACADLSGRRVVRGEPPAHALAPRVRSRAVVDEGRGPFLFSVLELEAGARLPLGGDGLPRVLVGLEGSSSIVSGSVRAQLAKGMGVLLPAALPASELVGETSARVALAVPSL